MSKFCTKCGTQLPDEARFCTECGSAVKVRTAQQRPAAPPRDKRQQQRPAAGETRKDARQSRPQEGKAQKPAQPKKAAAEAKKKKSSKKWIITGVAAVLVAGIAVGALFLTGVIGKSDNALIRGVIEQYTVPSEDLVEYAEVSDMAAIQVKCCELRSIDVVSKTDKTITLSIKAPDLRPFFIDVINTDREITDYAAEMEALDKKVKQLLYDGDVQYVESEVTVNYSVAADGSAQIEENDEFYDAIYGGLFSLINSYEGAN